MSFLPASNVLPDWVPHPELGSHSALLDYSPKSGGRASLASSPGVGEAAEAVKKKYGVFLAEDRYQDGYTHKLGYCCVSGMERTAARPEHNHGPGGWTLHQPVEDEEGEEVDTVSFAAAATSTFKLSGVDDLQNSLVGLLCRFDKPSDTYTSASTSAGDGSGGSIAEDSGGTSTPPSAEGEMGRQISPGAEDNQGDALALMPGLPHHPGTFENWRNENFSFELTDGIAYMTPTRPEANSAHIFGTCHQSKASHLDVLTGSDRPRCLSSTTISAPVDESALSNINDPSSLDRPKKQRRPPKPKRMKAKRLAAMEFRAQCEQEAGELTQVGESEFLRKVSNDDEVRKYACSVLRALNREAIGRMAHGEDASLTAVCL